MNLIRRNPYNDMAFLQNQFNHLFESAFQSWPGEATATNGWGRMVRLRGRSL
jgi:hypothetical protein